MVATLKVVGVVVWCVVRAAWNVGPFVMTHVVFSRRCVIDGRLGVAGRSRGSSVPVPLSVHAAPTTQLMNAFKNNHHMIASSDGLTSKCLIRSHSGNFTWARSFRKDDRITPPPSAPVLNNEETVLRGVMNRTVRRLFAGNCDMLQTCDVRRVPVTVQ